MESRLYICSRCGKVVKSTSGILKHDIVCKISIFLLYCQTLNPEPVLDYNTIHLLNLPSNNNKEDIKQVVLDNHNKKIRPADMDDNKKNISPADIDK